MAMPTATIKKSDFQGFGVNVFESMVDDLVQRGVVSHENRNDPELEIVVQVIAINQ